MTCARGFSCFFADHPSLLPSLFFLLGLSLSVELKVVFFLILLAFSIPLIYQPKKLFLLYCLCIFAFFYGKHTEQKFPKDRASLQGTAVFSVSEIKNQQSHFKKTTSLQGYISSMEGDCGESAYNIPCTFRIPSSLRPLQYRTYQIEGTLEKKDKYFSFTPVPDTIWQGQNKAICLPEWRFTIKETLKKSIEKRYPNSTVSDFLIALTLGDLDNRLLRFSFGKLGLQHILAISGFHFSLLSLFIGCFLRLLFKEKTAILVLLTILTGYFFLLHEAPSIIRAYFAITLYLGGKLLGYKPKAINLLGITLLIELFLLPQSVKNLGFQLSFLATASILLLFPITFSWMTKLFPRRNDKQALTFPSLEKFVYLMCCFLRSTFAVNLAVSLTVIPTCLWYFNTFPLASLIYNLFIPFSVFIILLLFLLALPFSVLASPFSTFVDRLNENFTAKILDLLIQSPNCLDVPLRIPFISETLLYIYLLVVFTFAILQQKKERGDFTISSLSFRSLLYKILITYLRIRKKS